MKTVPLHGKKAAGRVALVDDEDYDLVMQHRWNVFEKLGTDTRRPVGPYANTGLGKVNGKKIFIRLHNLITGWPLVDHIDHDGLNNQRSNLRPATTAQNGQNSRRKITAGSQFKGITWDSRDALWKARIETFGSARTVCATPVEIEAAYAYDAAARELFGEFACTNFPEGPTEAMQHQWVAERAERSALLEARARAARSESKRSWWEGRESETYVCEICDKSFQAKTTTFARYCGANCKAAAYRRRCREREAAGRLF